ncbi:MAG: hypothetical protein FRX49_07330 [Trebouxia sp. A1-2]|nr:MAG: hypothetical protein FRX49_07330 [Trebouxia sp. A1-2]
MDTQADPQMGLRNIPDKDFASSGRASYDPSTLHPHPMEGHLHLQSPRTQTAPELTESDLKVTGQRAKENKERGPGKGPRREETGTGDRAREQRKGPRRHRKGPKGKGVKRTVEGANQTGEGAKGAEDEAKQTGEWGRGQGDRCQEERGTGQEERGRSEGERGRIKGDRGSPGMEGTNSYHIAHS